MEWYRRGTDSLTNKTTRIKRFLKMMGKVRVLRAAVPYLEPELPCKREDKPPKASVHMQADPVTLGDLGDVGYVIEDSMREA